MILFYGLGLFTGFLIAEIWCMLMEHSLYPVALAVFCAALLLMEARAIGRCNERD